MWVRNSIHQSKNACWPHKVAWSYQWSYDYPQKRPLLFVNFLLFAVVCHGTVMVVIACYWFEIQCLRWQKTVIGNVSLWVTMTSMYFTKWTLDKFSANMWIIDT
jgi:hypothetical protein